jgi:hypothetical protein
MATVRDSITWANFEAELRAYLGITAPEDETTLQGQLDAATAEADRFLANPFVDSDGLDLPIPDAVKMGLKVWVHTIRQVSGILAPQAGVSSIKVGDNSIGYAASAVTSVDPVKRALEAARPHWQFWRCKVWR